MGMLPFESNPDIPDKVYFTIGEVAQIVGVKAYVLRYWEGQFSVLNPIKSPNDRRMYRRKDVENALVIKHLLYDLKYSIEGARKKMSSIVRTQASAAATHLELARAELNAIIELCR